MNELTYVDGVFPYWCAKDYYDKTLPKISDSLTDDEKFLLSFHEGVPLLYLATIQQLAINFDITKGETNIQMILSSDIFRIEVLYEGVTAFQFGYGENYGAYNEIYISYISLSSTKRQYFLSHFYPIKDTKFDFIEYESLRIISKQYITNS